MTTDDRFDDQLSEAGYAARENAAMRDAATLLTQVGQIPVPTDLAARLARRLQTRLQADAEFAPRAAADPPLSPFEAAWDGASMADRPTDPAVPTTPMWPEAVAHRARRWRRPPRWLVAAGSLAALIAILVGLGVAAQHSLPGDPLYSVKEWQIQVAYARNNDPTDASQFALNQLQSTLSDFQATVTQGRSGDAVQVALQSVVTWTQTSQREVAALPAGPDHDARQADLTAALSQEQLVLRSALPNLAWSPRVAVTAQLGAIGAQTPTISGGQVARLGEETLAVTLTGANFSANARLVVDGRVTNATFVSTASGQYLATLRGRSLDAGSHSLGVLNSDGTAAQITLTIPRSGDENSSGTTPSPQGTPSGDEHAGGSGANGQVTPTPEGSDGSDQHNSTHATPSPNATSLPSH